MTQKKRRIDGDGGADVGKGNKKSKSSGSSSIKEDDKGDLNKGNFDVDSIADEAWQHLLNYFNSCNFAIDEEVESEAGEDGEDGDDNDNDDDDAVQGDKRDDSAKGKKKISKEQTAAGTSASAAVTRKKKATTNSCHVEGEFEGDTDELIELMKKLEPVLGDGNKEHPEKQKKEDFTKTKQSLLPVLMSVAAYIMADHAITRFLVLQQQGDDVVGGSSIKEVEKEIELYLGRSIAYYPQNAATWSMAANFGRMTGRLSSPQQVAAWYRHAAKCAREIQELSLQTLESMADEEEEEGEEMDEGMSNKEGEGEKTKEKDKKSKEKEKDKAGGGAEGDEEDEEMLMSGLTLLSSDVREWIELLLLNQVAGVEWLGDMDDASFDDDSDDEDDDDPDQEGKGRKEKGTNDSGKSKEKASKEKKKEDKVKGDKEQGKEDEEGGTEEKENDDDNDVVDEWSESTVEATSRFMAAMALSMAGEHDQALEELKGFNVSHRLHPNVWDNGQHSKGAATNENETPLSSATTTGVEEPVVFKRKGGDAVGKDDGVLPSDLYRRLRNVFAPNAAYWRESDYTNRGYYSYFIDRPEKKQSSSWKPTNVMEDVIINHLLPLAQRFLDRQKKDNAKKNGKKGENKDEHDDDDDDDDGKSICGFEWWVHTRAVKANLGHNLHFDTDEALLSQEGKVTHPAVSSVLYLSGGSSQSGGDSGSTRGKGGATIILDQSPDSETAARVGWRNYPVDNSFLVFPGQLLHGVLPCSYDCDGVTKGDGESTPTMSDLWKDGDATGGNESGSNEQHRLTLMVGFWTRRVPDGMKTRTLYGPCGPMPPSGTEEHTWMNDVIEGYDDDDDAAGTGGGEGVEKNENSLAAAPVERVSPFWQEINPDAGGKKSGKEEEEEERKPDEQQEEAGREESRPLFKIPAAIDHRFFVDGAPGCFRESLFE